MQSGVRAVRPDDHYVGMARSIRTIVAVDGFSGLWRGLTPRVLSIAPSYAFAFVSYEYIKNLARTEPPADNGL